MRTGLRLLAIAVGIALLTLVAASSARYAPHTAVSGRQPGGAPTTEFATVSKLMNDAIAAQRLPGGVVVIGHGGRIVFHQAYGSRTLAGEPGLDGSPAAAEPMTEDTIFDIASLTKCLATATAVMQLYEQGKVAFDDPVQTYLPDFNTANDPQRAKVTVRMLLTQTSGEGIDVSLGDPWGLDGADKAEGIHRALTTPLQSGPGEVFRYSDINYILLGALIEKLTGEAEDVYVQRNVFAPLGMEETRYLPPAKACGPHRSEELRLHGLPRHEGACWRPVLQVPGAPVCCRASHQRQLTRKAEPIRVRIPITATCFGAPCMTRRRAAWGEWPGMPVCSRRRTMSSIYAQALLDRLADRPSKFPLKQATLGVDDDSPAARTYSSTSRSGERCRPRSHRTDTKHNRSAAGSQLSGDRGTAAVRLWLGYRYGLFQAARLDLSHR